MITINEILGMGFVPYTGGPVRGETKDFYIKPINNLGWNLGIDVQNKKCFYFEGDRPSAFPYPIPATVITCFTYPESIVELENILHSLKVNM
jgi:hypothetical protein